MCPCMEALMKPQALVDKKDITRFLDTGNIMHLPTGQTRQAPVLRPLKAGRDGRLIVGKGWLEVHFCPLCGEKVQAEVAALLAGGQAP
jgi:hypothetical protein